MPDEVVGLAVIESLGRGGAEQQLVWLIPALRRRRCRIEVVALWPPYDLAAELEREGVIVHRMDAGRRWLLPFLTLRLVWLCRRRGAHFLWAHLFMATLVSRLAGLVLGKPVSVISTLHSETYGKLVGFSRKQRFRRWLDRTTGKHLDNRVVAVSAAVARDHEVHLGWHDIPVIHNGVPTSGLCDTPLKELRIREEYDLSADDFLVVYPGRHSEEKGHENLIRATALLCQRRPHLRLQVVLPGRGPLTAQLQTMADDLGVSQFIAFPGLLPHDDTMALIASADLVVIPSRTEGLSVTATEAMSLGVPLVLTDVGGNRELSDGGRAGLLVPAESPEELADAIERLQREPVLRQDLARRGRERVRQHFSLEQAADDWARELVAIATRAS